MVEMGRFYVHMMRAPQRRLRGANSTALYVDAQERLFPNPCTGRETPKRYAGTDPGLPNDTTLKIPSNDDARSTSLMPA